MHATHYTPFRLSVLHHAMHPYSTSHPMYKAALCCDSSLPETRGMHDVWDCLCAEQIALGAESEDICIATKDEEATLETRRGYGSPMVCFVSGRIGVHGHIANRC